MKVSIGKALSKKKIVAILIVLAAALVMFFSNPEIGDFFMKEDSVSLSFQTGIEYDVVPYKNEMFMINNEGIYAIDRSGRESWNMVSTATSPYVLVKENNILLADLSGRKIRTFQGEKIVSEIETQNEILSARVNKNGYIAMATSELGYKGLAVLYDNHGKEIYRWHSGAGYIGAIDVSPNNRLAVSQLVTDKEEVYSKILLINPKAEEEPKCIAELKGIVTKLQYTENGFLIALSNNGLYGFKKSGKEKFSVDFSGRRLLKCNIENQNNMVLAFDSGLNSTVLESYSSSGKLRGSLDTGGEVNTIDANGECIVAVSHDKIIRLNPKGTVSKEIKINTDVKTVKIFGDRSRILVLGDGGAEIMNIK